MIFFSWYHSFLVIIVQGGSSKRYKNKGVID